MEITPKILCLVALSCFALVAGCNKVHAGRKTVSASADATGSHVGSADLEGPATVTCVSATDDTGTVKPPTCVVVAPGTNGVVKIGDKVAVTGAGKLVLTCAGKGTLACTARVEE
jgi:hypothetical protein